MRKIAFICLAFITVFTMFVGSALAAVSYDGEINEDLAVVLMDADSGKVLYEQKADERIRPASTTKVLTCLVAIEHGNLNDTVTVSSHAAGVSGSELTIKTDEEFKLEDLLVGMILRSGNDAATAIAEHIGGTEEDFVTMMNDLAQEIGMTSSTFENPHGKDQDGHMVTAHDMALLAKYAMNNPAFMQIVGHETYVMPETNKQRERTIKTYNEFLIKDDSNYYEYANGMKTGSTTGAGGCLVASATKDDQNLVCVVFGDTSNGKQQRWDAARSLFEYGFDNYTTIDSLSLVDTTEPLSAQVENYASTDIYDGLLEFAQPTPIERYLTLENDVAEQILSGDTIEVTREYYEEPLTAPIYENDVVGTVTFKSFKTGMVVMQGYLVATRDVLDAGSAPGSVGDSAVMTMAPTAMESLEDDRDNSALLILLVIPAGLIIFLAIRLFSMKRKKRRKYRRRTPHYSYKIRK